MQTPVFRTRVQTIQTVGQHIGGISRSHEPPVRPCVSDRGPSHSNCRDTLKWDRWFARTTCPTLCFGYYCCFHYCNSCYYYYYYYIYCKYYYVPLI